MKPAAKIRVICTLGPASLNEITMAGLEAAGVDLFRINLSHTPIDDLESTIELIRSASAVPICLDTQGAQVRCGKVAPGTVLQPGETITLTAEQVEGDAEKLTLWPAATFDALLVGSVVNVDFHGASMRVIAPSSAEATALVERGGPIGSNKAVVVTPSPSLPALTDKDLAAIHIGAAMGIEYYALSFAASEEGVRWTRALIPDGSWLISKIESRAGLRNIDGIIPASDAVLLDRGDLSHEVPLVEVPYYQKTVARRANRWHKPLYVATNLLESMVLNSRPTIAEMNDIANTLLDGAHGLVLAAETAIGVDPVGAVSLVSRAVTAFERVHTDRLALLDETTGLVHAPGLAAG